MGQGKDNCVSGEVKIRFLWITPTIADHLRLTGKRDFSSTACSATSTPIALFMNRR